MTPGIGIVGYAFQIYFDFSGYSDMASGLALMMGFVLIQNFDSPYQADSITDFWRRWHISLSTWLRDYLYIPLGGNRRGPIRTYANLMTVMLIGGLWHGASWNFVIWGAIHGAMLAFERMQGKQGPYLHLPRPWRVGLTFGIVCITWVFFRAQTLPRALTYLACLFGLGPAPAGSDAVAAIMYKDYHVLIFAVAAVLVWQSPTSWVFSRRITWAARGVRERPAPALHGLHVDAERESIHLLPVLRRLMPILTDGQTWRARLTRLFPGPGQTMAEGRARGPEPRHPDHRDPPSPGQGADLGFSRDHRGRAGRPDDPRADSPVEDPGPDGLHQCPHARNLDAFEKDLTRQSFARQFVKPRLQLSLSRELGFGTTQVILGREGWLFYRPGIDWLTGPGLLDATRLALRKRDLLDEGEAKPSPDPLPAIRAFHQDCRKAGVHLVVVPVPDKATLQAAELTSRFDRKDPGGPPVNVDYRRFLQDLRASGVDVFDPTPKDVRPSDPPRFLRQDTHWTPEWMEAVAHDLADHLKVRIPALRRDASLARPGDTG